MNTERKGPHAAAPEITRETPTLFSSENTEIRSPRDREALSLALVNYLGRIGYAVALSPLGKPAAPRPIFYVGEKGGRGTADGTRRICFLQDVGAGDFIFGAVTHGDWSTTIPYMDWSGPIRPEKIGSMIAAIFASGPAVDRGRSLLAAS